MTTAATAPAAGPGRPRRWWLAFLLNLIFAPAGYAYAGAWVTVAILFLLAATVPMILFEATLQYPPGLYALGLDGMLAVGGVMVVVMAAHAAWLAEQKPAKTGSRWRHAGLYAATWVAGVGLSLLMRAYWPNPTYTVSGSSMAPTLEQGDIAAVDGARATCGHRGLKPGQVVLYRRPVDRAPYMERIVAGPGQTVAMKDGLLVIDGKTVARRALGSVALSDIPVRATVIEETLANGAIYRTYDLGPDEALDRVATTTVPAGSWYLMADNRDNAADSRAHGPISGRDVCAIGLKVVASKDESRVGQKL